MNGFINTLNVYTFARVALEANTRCADKPRRACVANISGKLTPIFLKILIAESIQNHIFTFL